MKDTILIFIEFTMKPENFNILKIFKAQFCAVYLGFTLVDISPVLVPIGLILTIFKGLANRKLWQKCPMDPGIRHVSSNVSQYLPPVLPKLTVG